MSLLVCNFSGCPFAVYRSSPGKHTLGGLACDYQREEITDRSNNHLGLFSLPQTNVIIKKCTRYLWMHVFLTTGGLDFWQKRYDDKISSRCCDGIFGRQLGELLYCLTQLNPKVRSASLLHAVDYLPWSALYYMATVALNGMPDSGVEARHAMMLTHVRWRAITGAKIATKV